MDYYHECLDAYDEGYVAFLEGKTEKENSYGGDIAKAWMDGWRDARNDAGEDDENPS